MADRTELPNTDCISRRGCREAARELSSAISDMLRNIPVSSIRPLGNASLEAFDLLGRSAFQVFAHSPGDLARPAQTSHHPGSCRSGRRNPARNRCSAGAHGGSRFLSPCVPYVGMCVLDKVHHPFPGSRQLHFMQFEISSGGNECATHGAVLRGNRDMQTEARPPRRRMEAPGHRSCRRPQPRGTAGPAAM